MTDKLNVYLYGKKAGVLTEDENAQISFKYESNAKHPLTVRMPIREEKYPHAFAYSFFENLTPEGEPLELIANRLRLSENNPFSILEKIGGDCAGAVALYEGNIPKKTNEPLIKISKKKLACIIDDLPKNPLLIGMKKPPRLSLAGAQSKFAVYKDEKGYYSPNDYYPSTQIIKIGNDRYKNLLYNELFCMKLASHLGLPSPQNVSLKETDGRVYLDIDRYDRKIIPKGVKRIHQEDFCQALGYPSAKKYQADGGPSMRDCYKAIIQYSQNKTSDAFSFLQWMAFNYLIGNADAHAKNISFLHKGSRVVLAPFYDLLSTEIYSEKITSRKIAMLINGKDIYEKINRKDFLAAYEQYGLNPLQTIKNISQFFQETLKKAKAVKAQLNSEKLTSSAVYSNIIALITKRLSAIIL